MSLHSDQEKSLITRNSTSLSMSSVTTLRWTLEEDIDNYRAAGFEAIGVMRQKVAEFGEDQAVNMLATSGLHVSSLLWAGGFTGSGGQGFREALDDAHEALRLAGSLGAGCLVVYPGGRNNHIHSHADRLFRAALESMLYFAETAEITLAIEPMHPACAQDWTFLTDMESVLSLIEAVDSPYLKIVFDTYHFGQDRSLLCNLREIIPYLALVQLGDLCEVHSHDCNRCQLGEGDVPLQVIMSELIDGGYSGPFEIELAGVEFGPRSYHRVLAESKRGIEALLPARLNTSFS